uniref:Uncharacterized protein n=1 Tax=Ditylenchus dipsaci TaxID=166011 RepID=A0A915E627_9BILA
MPCAILLILFLHTLVSCRNPGGTSDLLKHILDNYDKRIRPFADENRAVVVEMTIVLAILTELKENQQIASFVISHVQKWQDPGLAWSPKQFHGIQQMVIPESEIWVPKIFIYNSMDTKEMLTDNRYDLRVSFDGRVKINMPQYVTCICRLAIERFPFDTQFCAIALASPLLSTSEMDVNATKPPADSYFSGNTEWEMMNVTVRHMRFMEDGEYRAEVHYIMHLHRRPIYYITVIVAPTFLISMLSGLGIFSPGSNDGPRSEKVSLGLGSLLAMTVLLDIVAATMPKSNSIPLLGYYIIAVIVLCALGVAISMAFLAISRKLIQTEQMPSSFAYKLFWVSRKHKPLENDKCHGIDYWLQTTSTLAESFNSQDYTTKESFLTLPDLLAIYNQVEEIAQSQTTFKKKLEKQKWREEVEKEWNRLFGRFDFMALFVSKL